VALSRNDSIPPALLSVVLASTAVAAMSTAAVTVADVWARLRLSVTGSTACATALCHDRQGLFQLGLSRAPEAFFFARMQTQMKGLKDGWSQENALQPRQTREEKVLVYKEVDEEKRHTKFKHTRRQIKM